VRPGQVIRAPLVLWVLAIEASVRVTGEVSRSWTNPRLAFWAAHPAARVLHLQTAADEKPLQVFCWLVPLRSIPISLRLISNRRRS